MSADGEIDYSGYTRAQLEEALGNIDEAAYPINLRRLREALARKEAAGPEPVEFPERWVLVGPWAVALGRILCGVFAAVGVWILARMAVRPQSFLAGFTTSIPADVLSPTAQGWLMGLAFAGLGAWMFDKVGRIWLVSVVGQTLEVRRGREYEALPLSDVDSIDVVRYGSGDTNSLVRIVLRRESVAGTTIDVSGLSRESIRRLQEIVAFVHWKDGN